METAYSPYFLVDLTDAAQKQAMEQAFYQAFNTVELQGLIREIWHWDDAQQRISLRLSHEEVTAAALRDEQQQVCFYVLGSIEPKTFSQFGYYGFTAPERPGRYIEILSIFRTPHFDGNIGRLVTGFLRPFCFTTALSLGCTYLLGTCAPKLLPLYLRWGWQLLDTRQIKGETRHFLQFDLDQAS